MKRSLKFGKVAGVSFPVKGLDIRIFLNSGMVNGEANYTHKLLVDTTNTT